MLWISSKSDEECIKQRQNLIYDLKDIVDVTVTIFTRLKIP